MKTFPVDTHFQDDDRPSPPTWNQTSFHVITLHWFTSLFCSVLLFSLPFHWGCHPVMSLRAVFESLSSKSSLLCRDPGSHISHMDVKMQTLWLWSLAQRPTSPVMYEMVVEGSATDLVCVASRSFPYSVVSSVKVEGWFPDSLGCEMRGLFHKWRYDYMFWPILIKYWSI